MPGICYRAEIEAEGLSLRYKAREAYAQWLGAKLSAFPWAWYVTLTFEQADIGLRRADGAWQAWLNSLKLMAKPEKLFYARVTERQARGTPHFHSLIGPGLKGIRRLLFKDLWELNGHARVEAYKPMLGAGFYLAKGACVEYVSKQYEADIRLSHGLERWLKAR